MSWKLPGRKFSWPADMWVEETEKNHENSQDDRYPCPDSNQALP
jgi:hypothetical protein